MPCTRRAHVGHGAAAFLPSDISKALCRLSTRKHRPINLTYFSSEKKYRRKNPTARRCFNSRSQGGLCRHGAMRAVEMCGVGEGGRKQRAARGCAASQGAVLSAAPEPSGAAGAGSAVLRRCAPVRHCGNSAPGYGPSPA